MLIHNLNILFISLAFVKTYIHKVNALLKVLKPKSNRTYCMIFLLVKKKQKQNRTSTKLFISSISIHTEETQ